MTPNFFLRKEKMKNFKLRLLLLFFWISKFYSPLRIKSMKLMLNHAPKEVIERFMQKVFLKDKKAYSVLHNYLRYLGRR
jgi:hypothetical protein